MSRDMCWPQAAGLNWFKLAETDSVLKNLTGMTEEKGRREEGKGRGGEPYYFGLVRFGVQEGAIL